MKKILMIFVFMFLLFSCFSTNGEKIEYVKNITTEYGKFEDVLSSRLGINKKNLNWTVGGDTGDGYVVIVEDNKNIKVYIPVHKDGDFIKIYYAEVWIENKGLRETLF